MGSTVLRSLPAGLCIDATQCELQRTESQQDTQNRPVPHIVLKKQYGSQHKARSACLPASLGCALLCWLERDT